MSGRTRGESEFFDARYAEDTRAALSKFYAITRASTAFYQQALLARCPGAVLEFGCGEHADAFLLARHQADVLSIDISQVAVEKGAARAQRENLDITFSLMNGERTGLAPHAFDLVCGAAILHVLSLSSAMHEIARVLKPDGRAVFIEPLGHNPLINLYRSRTPQYRTAHEHPLTRQDLAALEACFHRCDVRFFHLFSLLAVPFRGRQGFGRLLRTLDRADRELFARVPGLRWLAWQVVIVLEQPRGTGASRAAGSARQRDPLRGHS